MDIGHTEDNMYFTFNHKFFSAVDIEEMKTVIDISDRRLVVITDPHIKVLNTYFVYTNGTRLE